MKVNRNRKVTPLDFCCPNLSSSGPKKEKKNAYYLGRRLYFVYAPGSTEQGSQMEGRTLGVTGTSDEGVETYNLHAVLLRSACSMLELQVLSDVVRATPGGNSGPIQYCPG